MTRCAALYRLMLRLCERGFREKYGREMELLFVIRCRELHAQRRSGAWIRWWLSSMVDVITTACLTHVHTDTRGDFVMTRILNLVAQSAFAAAGALLVFYAVLVRPMPAHQAGAILAAGIGCLSLALALTWASVFRHKRLVGKPSAISRQRSAV